MGRVCTVLGVLGVIVVLATVAALVHAWNLGRDLTDDHPLQLPSTGLPLAQLHALQDRIRAFQQAITQRQDTPPLELTDEELNALIETRPEAQPVRGKIFVAIEGNTLKGQLSVRMGELRFPVFRNRYLNGWATFRVELVNDMLRVSVEDFSSPRRRLPTVYMDKLREQNLVKSFRSDARFEAALERLKAVEVRDGRLVVTAKND